MIRKINLPLNEEDILALKAGDEVLIKGKVYTARDAAHKRFQSLIEKGESLPIDIAGGAIYYVGPSPTKEGDIIGAAGPTSSYRMDPYTEPLLKKGLKVMIGKGTRSDEYKDLLKKYKAVYLSAIGGAAASIGDSIKKCELICYEDLGAEAVRRLEVENFFAIVTYDTKGNDLFEDGIKQYKK